jgi:hypothetical protein
MRANVFQVVIFIATLFILTAAWFVDGLVVREIHRTEAETEAIKASLHPAEQELPLIPDDAPEAEGEII